jgi:pimeloyl-ACP methyl ester carboxylesterase
MTTLSQSVLRTPDACFDGLPGYAFEPHYVDDLPGFDGLRMHHLDEGPVDAPATFLCLHGQPTWSYLYRRMIPVFAATGARVVAPDLFGFGRSDKPQAESFYTFERHRDALLAFVQRLDLRHVTLVCQDWGGLLGLTLPMAMPERFERLIVMNTALATGEGSLGPGFLEWRAWVNANPDLPVAPLMQRMCPHISPAEAAAYEAPFPDARYKAGARRFPNLVPERPDDPGAAISQAAGRWWRESWQGRSFMAIGLQDHIIIPPFMHHLRRQIRGCPAPLELAEAGHFVQEHGERVAQAALASFAAPA